MTSVRFQSNTIFNGKLLKFQKEEIRKLPKDIIDWLFYDDECYESYFPRE